MKSDLSGNVCPEGAAEQSTGSGRQAQNRPIDARRKADLERDLREAIIPLTARGCHESQLKAFALLLLTLEPEMERSVVSQYIGDINKRLQRISGTIDEIAHI